MEKTFRVGVKRYSGNSDVTHSLDKKGREGQKRSTVTIKEKERRFISTGCFFPGFDNSVICIKFRKDGVR